MVEMRKPIPGIRGSPPCYGASPNNWDGNDFT